MSLKKHPTPACDLLRWLLENEPGPHAADRGVDPARVPEGLRDWIDYVAQEGLIDRSWGAWRRIWVNGVGKLSLTYDCDASTETDVDAKPKAKVSSRPVEMLLGEDADRILAIVYDEAKSADTKMREICGIDRTHLEKDSTAWAYLLECSPANIRKTHFWKVDRKRAIEALR